MPPELDALEHTVNREFNAWERAFPLNRLNHDLPPDPTVEDGLPKGWHLVGHLPDYQTDTDLFLTRRTKGGWVIVRHEYDIPRTKLFWVDLTFGDLFEHVLADAFFGSPADMERLPGVAGWLKEIALGSYDATDPTEAAEQALFALGGPLTALPRALA